MLITTFPPCCGIPCAAQHSCSCLWHGLGGSRWISSGVSLKILWRGAEPVWWFPGSDQRSPHWPWLHIGPWDREGVEQCPQSRLVSITFYSAGGRAAERWVPARNCSSKECGDKRAGQGGHSSYPGHAASAQGDGGPPGLGWLMSSVGWPGAAVTDSLEASSWYPGRAWVGDAQWQRWHGKVSSEALIEEP